MGPSLGGPHNKGYSFLGFILGYPLSWETTIYIGMCMCFCEYGIVLALVYENLYMFVSRRMIIHICICICAVRFIFV